MRSPILKNTYSIEKVIIKYKTCHGSVTLVSKLPVEFIKVICVVRRHLCTCPRSVEETAYISLVRPTLEYGSAALDPYH